MQNLFGVITHKPISQRYIDTTSPLYERSKTHIGKNIAYSFEINERTSFKECFHLSSHLHVLVAGDVLNKESLIQLIKSMLDTDYDVCKNCIIQSFNQIEGIFCIIIFNVLHKKICILSEKNGIIPIYYFYDKTEFIFSTSIKAIILAQNKQRRLNYNAVYEMFKIGFSIAPDTLFQDIYSLLPGTVLEFDGEVHLFTLPEDKQTVCPVNLKEAADIYFTLFEQSILKRVSHEKKTALLLSGGVDSAAIAAILHKHQIPIKCYTMDCNEEQPIEKTGAQKICNLFQFEHIADTQFDKEIVPSLIHTICLNEAPVFNGIMEYALSKMIETDTQVVLTGDGNDLIWSIFPSNFRKILSKTGQHFSHFYLKLRSLYSDQLLQMLFQFPIDPQILCNKIDVIYNNSENFLKDVGKADIKIFGDCFAFTSLGKIKMKENHFLFRFPYLDPYIESFVVNLPESFKHSYSTDAPFINKFLFKYALEQKQLLPKEVIHTPKTWMYSPNATWLRTRLKSEFESIVFDKYAIANELFNMNMIRQAWKLHTDHQQDYSVLLMMVLQFELWNKIRSAVE